MYIKEQSNKDLLILLYIGAPKDIDDVRTFILNIFSDKEAIDFKLPLFMQKLIAKIIVNVRLKKIKHIYTSLFNGKSPQIAILDSFKKKLCNLYQETHRRELIIKFGMCYTSPYIEELTKDERENSYNKVFVCTLYPHYSYTTTGVCIKRFINVTFNKPYQELKLITYWYNNYTFNELIKDRIVDAAGKIHAKLGDCILLFAAHALPADTLKKGDIYSHQLEHHVNIILDLLKPQFPMDYYLCYQSKATFGKWLQPYTHIIVDRLIAKKVKKVIFVPITFVSDHIETVYEIDGLYIKKLKEHGIDAIRIENFNDNIDFVKVINSLLY
jgi:ferrochelatase